MTEFALDFFTGACHDCRYDIGRNNLSCGLWNYPYLRVELEDLPEQIGHLQRRIEFTFADHLEVPCNEILASLSEFERFDLNNIRFVLTSFGMDGSERINEREFLEVTKISSYNKNGRYYAVVNFNQFQEIDYRKYSEIRVDYSRVQISIFINTRVSDRLS